MLADKTETLELYISILGLDKRYERKLYSLGLSELHEELVGSREQFRLGGRSSKELDRDRERERGGETALLPFFFYRPFWAPLPKRGEGSDNEEDPFDDFGFERFLDRFLEAMFRMSWLAIG